MKNEKTKAKLLLHSCCAPCLTSVYERLTSTYDIVVYWYNPNIWPKAEHYKRLKELIRYCKAMNIQLLVGEYEYEDEQEYWQTLIAGFESEPEKGKRCDICFSMRLEATAQTAAFLNNTSGHQPFDLFASELSVSPHKKAETLNRLGLEIAERTGIKYLTSDFKKNNGYKRSCELSKEHNLYRQSYCGCRYSKR